VAEVDPDDDSASRWVLHWYRYDPERHERRHTVIGAFDNEHEFLQHFDQASGEVQRRQATGESEQVEHISGFLMEAGYRAATFQKRIERDRVEHAWRSSGGWCVAPVGDQGDLDSLQDCRLLE
jgi:hypothetical protein